jgi:hypothetical protein
VLGAIFAASVGASSAGAVEFYNASAPRTYPGDALSYYYNPGPSNNGEAGHILFDDVSVPTTLSAPLFNVRKVTYKVTQKASAPDVFITPYFAQLYPDPVPNVPPRGGTGDLGFYDPRSPVQFATAAHLAGNIGSQTIERIVSFGDGVHTLFNVTGVNASSNTALRCFAVGMNLSTTDSQNGWTVSQQSQNMDLLWDYKNDSRYSEFTYSFDDNDGRVIGTQYLRVEGSILSGVPGDANADGCVNISDLLTLAMHWHQSGDYTAGDFNFDTVVNAQDLAILAANWQCNEYPSAFPVAALGLPVADPGVPEPALMLLPCLMLAGMLRARRPALPVVAASAAAI